MPIATSELSDERYNGNANLVIEYLRENLPRGKRNLYVILQAIHIADVMHMDLYGRFIIENISPSEEKYRSEGETLDAFSGSEIECLDKVIGMAYQGDIAEYIISKLSDAEMLLDLHRNRWK